MFIREKKNPSGSISIQIISKKNGKYKVIETIGCAKNDLEKEILLFKAKERLKELDPKLFYFDENKKGDNSFFGKIDFSNDRLVPIGDEIIFGRMYDEFGCGNILSEIKHLYSKNEKNFLFKSLVISKILYPGSKLYLKNYLFYFKKIEITEDKIYRFLDTLYNEEIKWQIEECIYKSSLKKIGGKLVVCFYDVTTLHFESESEDDLRIIGFSKEGKLNRPQVQLGLFTTTQGYPLAYDVYEGNKFEGHTLKENIEIFQKRFNLNGNKPIIVADKGMLNKNNLNFLENNGYFYIIGARIKNLPDELKRYISNLNFLSDSQTYEIYLDKDNKISKNKRNAKYRLVLSYSTQRMKKDRYLRKKHLNKLKLKIENFPNLTKADLKSPYKKYLDLGNDSDCKIKFKLNKEKIKLDEKLDGIKGYFTNNFNLSHNEIITHYANLHFIEEAFRISKTDLKIRPIYHRLEQRIKAHILVSFVAYAIYRDFTLKIKKRNINITRQILRDLIKHIFAIKTDSGLIPLRLSKIQ
ncbi:MAG: IS1634 family transposase, partial [Epsilonproteobacteria bacterium]|nr:IS1634 family transposase [Campylobacterota bacterium]